VTFEEYARQQLATLLRVSQAICGDRYLAEDLVQDVLIKLHSHWRDVSILEARDAYVRRMLVNEFLSWRRKWARLVPHADPADDAATEADPSGAFAERDAIAREIAALPPRQRVVVALRYLCDLSDADIAAALGCAESTVRVHAARALAALRVGRADHQRLEATNRGTS
jgi:RNA polymerase sigma-70 factor (sigma-E family)